jgi:Type II CAAX prenyl endopeptidase Rce1-like
MRACGWGWGDYNVQRDADPGTRFNAMKQCAYCGKEYADDVAECMFDKTPLGGGAARLESAAAEIAAVPPVLPSAVAVVGAVAVGPPPARAWTEREQRIIEVVLVCLVAFGSPFVSSLFILRGFSTGRSGSGAVGWVSSALHAATSLGLLGYVLMRRAKTFADLGLFWTKRDFGWSVPLWMAGAAAFYALYYAMYYTGLVSVNIGTASGRVSQQLFAGGVSVPAMLFQFLNPFYEELIVRAYLMTEVIELTGSVSRAVAISMAVQMSYHLYQGFPMVFALGAHFLVFSLYYAKTRRITPLILAHLFTDVSSTLLYWARHR